MIWKTNKGFSLIELMVVVAIIGVLAAVAIPSYQGYVMKAQINRALGEISAYKAVFEERVSRSASVANADIGYVPSKLTTGDANIDIATINADGTGNIQVTLGGNAHRNLVGAVVRLERTVSGGWSCVVDNSSIAATWKPDYLPPGCRL